MNRPIETLPACGKLIAMQAQAFMLNRRKNGNFTTADDNLISIIAFGRRAFLSNSQLTHQAHVFCLRIQFTYFAIHYASCRRVEADCCAL